MDQHLSLYQKMVLNGVFVTKWDVWDSFIQLDKTIKDDAGGFCTTIHDLLSLYQNDNYNISTYEQLKADINTTFEHFSKNAEDMCDEVVQFVRSTNAETNIDSLQFGYDYIQLFNKNKSFSIEYKDLPKNVEKICEYIVNAYGSGTKYFVKKREITDKRKGSIIDIYKKSEFKTGMNFLRDLLNPVKNNFELLDYKNTLKKERSREVWTDSECLLVVKSVYDSIKWKLDDEKI